MGSYPLAFIAMENDDLAHTWLLGFRRLDDPRFGRKYLPADDAEGAVDPWCADNRWRVESKGYGRKRQPWIHELASGHFEVDLDILLYERPASDIFGWSRIEYQRSTPKPGRGPMAESEGMFAESVGKPSVIFRSAELELGFYSQGMVAFGEGLHVGLLAFLLRGSFWKEPILYYPECQDRLEYLWEYMWPEAEKALVHNLHRIFAWLSQLRVFGVT